VSPLIGRGVVFTAVALGLGVADGQPSGIAAAFAKDGLPAVVSFDSRPVAGPRWHVHSVRSITWAKTYFGPSSNWQRFHLTPAAAGGQALTAWVDAIDAPDLAALAAHPVVRCYDFHLPALRVHPRLPADPGAHPRAAHPHGQPVGDAHGAARGHERRLTAEAQPASRMSRYQLLNAPTSSSFSASTPCENARERMPRCTRSHTS
jgi:hypothetical protein